MIRFRIDDVMWDSSGWDRKRATNRFSAFHHIIAETHGAIHVPALIVKDIENYPEVKDLVIKETLANRMFPQIHCYEHVNYEHLPKRKIEIHLINCLQWFHKNIQLHQPTLWITPWGSEGTEDMREVAKRWYLRIEGTKNTLSPQVALDTLKKHDTPAILHGQTIMDHWWTKGSKILRICQVIKRGSYQEAVLADKKSETPIFPENSK